jgi:uncharacterized protein YbjT (DUF2867 family)
MKVLIVGARGLIGTEVSRTLAARGHEVFGISRQPIAIFPGASFVLDLRQATLSKEWFPYLQGMDFVVNCAGLLQDSANESAVAVHIDAAGALFRAAEKKGVAVIHFSALGVDRLQPSAFSRTKLAGDEILEATENRWWILRPSVVLGRPVFGASALIRGLAALPVYPSMQNVGALQVVMLEDVISTVVALVERSPPKNSILELAGPDQLSFDQIVATYRRWYGWKTAKKIIVPQPIARILHWAGDLVGLMGWRPPVRSNALKEVARGAVGDPAKWQQETGITPSALSSWLSSQQPTVQDKWFARLYFIKPLLFVVLPAFWIATGIISLTVGWQSGVKLMLEGGAGVLAAPSVVAGALADIIVGALIALRSSARVGLIAAVTLSIFYALAGSAIRPDLWAEPLGPLLKIFPIIAAHLCALAILEDR